MSGPAPSNPGTPKVNSKAPNPSMAARRPGLIAAGVALGAGAIAYFMFPATPRSEPAASFRTTGVQNIEKAYTNAGATSTHTKAYGGTKMGDKENEGLKEGGASGHKEFDPMKQKEGLGDDQRPWIPSKAGEIFDKTMTGSSKGK